MSAEEPSASVHEELARAPLFASTAPPLLDLCARRARLIDIPRGSLLARQGELANDLYLLVRGSAEVSVRAVDGTEQTVDILGPGDSVGDLAMLLDQPRTATVTALRHCRALHFNGADFAWLLSNAPDFTLNLARTIAARLQRTTQGRARPRQIETIAVFPLSSTIDAGGWRNAIAEALARAGQQPCAVVAVEGEADASRAHAVAAEADALLLLGDAGSSRDDLRIAALLDAVATVSPQPQIGLVLIQDRPAPYRHSAAWLRDARIAACHHIRAHDPEDFDRLVRRITGRAVGLALSGGGARGFAHIGMIQALREARIPIDYVCGTSMGAIIAAQVAMGFDTAEMICLTREAYVEDGGSDFAFPAVAIQSGRGTERRLKRMFGDTRIEDLATPYFAVAADLRRAETIVLDRGRLWRAARISCSVPGLLPPVRMRGRLLVDGGLLDNLPVDALRRRCPGTAIACDVSVSVEFSNLRQTGRRRLFRPPARTPGIGPILMRTAELASVRDSRIAGTPADLYLNPGFEDVGMSDFKRIDEIVERGAAYARERIAAWRE